jgi:predicted esterase
MADADEDKTLHLPRILCLHGGGTNARIFKIQCRVLERALNTHFRLAYAQAPYESTPEPDVASVYADYAPFTRWLRWAPEHPVVDDATARKDLELTIKTAMDEDDGAGATGPWVGLLGFSQGARVAASLLFKHQKRVEKLGVDETGPAWKFGVFLAGRPPLVTLDPDVFTSPMLSDPSAIDLSGRPDLMDEAGEEHLLCLPTIHVHGAYDPSIDLQRELMEQYCSDDSVRVLEWDGGHRIPFKSVDIEPLVELILEIAEETEALEH